MVKAQSILIADDEDTFLRATAELLRGDGYDCDAVPDAHQALERLRTRRYDLLIADIKMPGNPNLELVEEAEQLAPGMPVLLVTGYPSVDSAVRSIELPVIAYLEKPVRFDELRKHVRDSLQYSQAHRAVTQVQEHLRKCIEELEEVKRHRWWPKEGEKRGVVAVPLVTLRTLAACVSELLRLERAIGPTRNGPIFCQLIECPRWPVYRDALGRAVKVLQETKRRFKSKELAELREMLEELLGRGPGAAPRS